MPIVRKSRKSTFIIINYLPLVWKTMYFWKMIKFAYIYDRPVFVHAICCFWGSMTFINKNTLRMAAYKHIYRESL